MHGNSSLISGQLKIKPDFYNGKRNMRKFIAEN